MCSKAIVCVLVLLYLSKTITSDGKEFCESFADNDYRIDYGYYLAQSQRDSAHYLFIGDQYWILNWAESTVVSLRDLSYTKPFDKNLNERCAFTLDECERKDCQSFGTKVTGFLRFYTDETKVFKYWTVKWITIGMDSSNKKLNYDLSEKMDDSHIGFISLDKDGNHSHLHPLHYNTSVCFNFLSDSFCFVQQILEKNLEYKTIYLCYKYTDRIIKIDERTINDTFKIGRIPTQIFKDQVLAIFPKFKILDKNYLNGSERYSYLFLLKKEKSIYYCFSPPLLFYKGCVNESKLLIDCSGAHFYNVTIPLIVIGLLVILAIGSVILFLVYRVFLYYSQLRQKNKIGKPSKPEVFTLSSEREIQSKRVTKPLKTRKKTPVK